MQDFTLISCCADCNSVYERVWHGKTRFYQQVARVNSSAETMYVTVLQEYEEENKQEASVVSKKAAIQEAVASDAGDEVAVGPSAVKIISIGTFPPTAATDDDDDGDIK